MIKHILPYLTHRVTVAEALGHDKMIVGVKEIQVLIDEITALRAGRIAAGVRGQARRNAYQRRTQRNDPKG